MWPTCDNAINLYKYVFDRIKLGATVNINKMILSHERLPGDKDDQLIKYELIDTVAAIALKWILMSRITQNRLIYSDCLKDIINHLHHIADSYPKYRAVIAGLDFELDTG